MHIDCDRSFSYILKCKGNSGQRREVMKKEWYCRCTLYMSVWLYLVIQFVLYHELIKQTANKFYNLKYKINQIVSRDADIDYKLNDTAKQPI